MLRHNTPIEMHDLHGVPIFVKREDLCCPYPGPSFSKMRGVVAHIAARPEKVIGCLDTFHSKAGWAVAWACSKLGKRAIDFWPHYKADNYVQGHPAPRPQQREAAQLGAALVALPAGRSSVLFHTAKKRLTEYGEGIDTETYMMPNALKLSESISENAAEAKRTAPFLPKKPTIVLSVSSGTVAAGVLLGLHQGGVLDTCRIILHMGYSRSKSNLLKYMTEVSGLDLGLYPISVIDEKYDYKNPARGVQAPFPCNPYYDLKAWKWLSNNVAMDAVPRPIVFWNIGD